MAETYLRDIAANSATAFSAYGPLAALFKKIEVGLIDSIIDQEILGSEMPYLGTSVTGLGPDVGQGEGVVNGSTHRVPVRVDLGLIDAKQITGEGRMRDMIATLNKAVGLQKVGNKFSLNNLVGRIEDVFIGQGDIVAIGTPEKAADGFFVIAQYRYSVLYRLYLVP